MSQLQPNTNNIALQGFLEESLQIKEKNLFQMLLTQVEKDLNMCGLDWENESPTQPNQLLSELDSIVTKLLKGTHNKDIRTLLYRIDVREKNLYQLETLTVNEITNIIIKREIEKIWMKHKYSTL